jgi:hypothetical protein
MLASLSKGVLTPNLKKRLRDGSFNDKLGIQPDTKRRPPAPLDEPDDEMKDTLIDLPGMVGDISSGISSAFDFITSSLTRGDDKYTPIIQPTPEPAHVTPQQPTTPPNAAVEESVDTVPIPVVTPPLPYEATPASADQSIPSASSTPPSDPAPNIGLPPRRDYVLPPDKYDTNFRIDYSRFETTRPRDFDVSEYMSLFSSGLAQGAISGIVGHHLGFGTQSLFGIYNTFENVLRSNSRTDALKAGRMLGERARLPFSSPENAISHVASISVSQNRISPDVTEILAPQGSNHQGTSVQSPQDNVALLRNDFLNYYTHASAPYAV